VICPSHITRRHHPAVPPPFLATHIFPAITHETRNSRLRLPVCDNFEENEKSLNKKNNAASPTDVLPPSGVCSLPHQCTSGEHVPSQPAFVPYSRFGGAVFLKTPFGAKRPLPALRRRRVVRIRTRVRRHSNWYPCPIEFPNRCPRQNARIAQNVLSHTPTHLQHKKPPLSPQH
jgi:hypothetical protein